MELVFVYLASSQQGVSLETSIVKIYQFCPELDCMAGFLKMENSTRPMLQEQERLLSPQDITKPVQDMMLYASIAHLHPDVLTAIRQVRVCHRPNATRRSHAEMMCCSTPHH